MKKENVCKGCGQCCYNVPLPQDLVSATRNRIVTQPLRWESISDRKELRKMVVGITPDGRCPYLTEKNLCNIYDKRPWICRKFGASKDENDLLYCQILHGKGDCLTEKQQESINQLMYNVLNNEI